MTEDGETSSEEDVCTESSRYCSEACQPFKCPTSMTDLIPAGLWSHLQCNPSNRDQKQSWTRKVWQYNKTIQGLVVKCSLLNSSNKRCCVLAQTHKSTTHYYASGQRKPWIWWQYTRMFLVWKRRENSHHGPCPAFNSIRTYFKINI